MSLPNQRFPCRKQWKEWDGELKSVAVLYNNMTAEGKKRLHIYLHEQVQPKQKERDDGLSK